MKTFLTIAGVLTVVLSSLLIFTLRFESQSFAHDVAISSPYQIEQAPPVAFQQSFNQPANTNYSQPIAATFQNHAGTLPPSPQPGPSAGQAYHTPGLPQFAAQPVVQKQIANSQPSGFGPLTSNKPFSPPKATIPNRLAVTSTHPIRSTPGTGFASKIGQQPAGSTIRPTTTSPNRSSWPTTYTTSTNRSSWPSNANNVRTLVRTEYTLPAKAADSIVMFFSIEGTDKIETKIDSDPKTNLVKLVVTTDQKTQLAIAHFLDAVYPKSRIEDLKKAAQDRPDLEPEAASELPKVTALETNWDDAPVTEASTAEVLDKLLDEFDAPKKTESIDEER